MMLSPKWLVCATLAVLLMASANVANAGSFPTPTEKPILTISGKIGELNQGDTLVLDRAMLEKIGMVTVETTTPWHSGVVKFDGVPLAKLMREIGAKGQSVVVTALNDYTTELPVEDFEKFGPILALKRNDEYMSVRDKGPLFIIYPYDHNTELKSQKYYSRSAWQVGKIEIK